MVKHIVLFQFQDFAEGKTKVENLQIVKEKLENLIHFIPQLRKIEVGLNLEESPQSNFDMALTTEFENYQDLSIYTDHPEHQAVLVYIGKVKKERVCVDYEI